MYAVENVKCARQIFMVNNSIHSIQADILLWMHLGINIKMSKSDGCKRQSVIIISHVYL
jgi:hypothetical protein